MTNAQMKAEVRRMLGNMQTSDPFYADVQTWVNRGIQDVVLIGVQGASSGTDLFPELRCAWKSTLSANGINHQPLPDDKILITSMGSFDKSSAVDTNVDRALPMNYVTPEVFELLVKDGTRVGWPRIWTMRGRDFYYHPTPVSTPIDYRTFMLLHGIERDPYPDLSADGDVPKISSLWHDVCVTRAAAIGARRKNWIDRADSWDAEVGRRLGFSTDIGARQDAAHSLTVHIDGLISREGVYGGEF